MTLSLYGAGDTPAAARLRAILRETLAGNLITIRNAELRVAA